MGSTKPEGILQIMCSLKKAPLDESPMARRTLRMSGRVSAWCTPDAQSTLELGHEGNTRLVATALRRVARANTSTRIVPGCEGVKWGDRTLTMRRSSRLACRRPSRVVLGLERAASVTYYR